VSLCLVCNILCKVASCERTWAMAHVDPMVLSTEATYPIWSPAQEEIGEMEASTTPKVWIRRARRSIGTPSAWGCGGGGGLMNKKGRVVSVRRRARQA
jgi:hypothetical protein